MPELTEKQLARLQQAKAELDRFGLLEADSPVGRYVLELLQVWVTQPHTVETSLQTRAVLERIVESRSLGPEDGQLWFHARGGEN